MANEKRLDLSCCFEKNHTFSINDDIVRFLIGYPPVYTNDMMACVGYAIDRIIAAACLTQSAAIGRDPAEDLDKAKDVLRKRCDHLIAPITRDMNPAEQDSIIQKTIDIKVEYLFNLMLSQIYLEEAENVSKTNPKIVWGVAYEE